MDNQVRNGIVLVVKDDRVDCTRAEIRAPSTPAPEVIVPGEKDGTVTNGAEIAERRDCPFSGHGRFWRHSAHHLYREGIGDVVADIEHQRHVVADGRGRAGNDPPAGSDRRGRMVDRVQDTKSQKPAAHPTCGFRSVGVLCHGMRRQQGHRHNGQTTDTHHTHAVTSVPVWSPCVTSVRCARGRSSSTTFSFPFSASCSTERPVSRITGSASVRCSSGVTAAEHA